MVQAFNNRDTVNQKTVCEDIWKAQGNNIIHILTTNEANFQLLGYSNSQNCHYWATENICDIHQKTLLSEKIIIWCGVASFGLIGTYFLEKKAGGAVTVNSACYLEMIRAYLKPNLQRFGVEILTVWFQQDGATAQTARNAM